MSDFKATRSGECHSNEGCDTEKIKSSKFWQFFSEVENNDYNNDNEDNNDNDDSNDNNNSIKSNDDNGHFEIRNISQNFWRILFWNRRDL